MSGWELTLQDAPERLVQLAILQAEFEAPASVSGRQRAPAARMLVPLYLWQHELMRRPMFYISACARSHGATSDYERPAGGIARRRLDRAGAASSSRPSTRAGRRESGQAPGILEAAMTS